MRLWGLTDPGNLRQQNQDAYRILNFGHERAMLLVCDGMGGARSGNVASELAAETFCSVVSSLQKSASNEEKIRAMLQQALHEANEAVYQKGQTDAEYAGMGTTLVAAFLQKNTAYLINVGDSRAYHISTGGIEQLTEDHSIVEMMVQRGELTHEQAKNHPGKNIITRAVGTEEAVSGDLSVKPMKKDECLLLCSDGLSNEMADQEILFEVAYGENLSDCCQRLLQIAKKRGAPDNVTLALAAL